MGAQSYHPLNRQSLFSSYEDRLIDLAHDLYVKDRFFIDCGLDKTEWLHTYLMYNAFSNCGCEINEFIKDKVGIDYSCKTPTSKVFHKHRHKEDFCEIEKCSAIEDEW
jgi:hypothetical protein